MQVGSGVGCVVLYCIVLYYESPVCLDIVGFFI